VPGTGKTRTILSALGLADVRRPLIVCPAIVRTHWAREIAVLGGGGNWAAIRSYDEIVRGGFPLMAEMIRERKIDALVIDEAHYLKHAGSKRAQLLIGRDGYAPRLPRVYAASGTPVPKNPYEFGTTLLSLFPEVAIEHNLRTLAEFKARFCITRGSMVRGAWREKILPTVREEAEFKEILSKVMLRRTLDDVGLDVPQLDWQITRLDGAADIDTYEDGLEVRHALDIGASLADIAEDPHVARMRRRLGELKVQPVAEMLTRQLEDSDEKIVVMAYHRSVMQELRSALLPFGVAYVDGDTTSQQRDIAIDRFQHNWACRVFLGQITACQTGITLTASRRVVIVEPSWTHKENVQAGHRVARIGQRASRCVVQFVTLAGTLDEAVVGQNLQEARFADTVETGGTAR
jgi:SNF2 family DNA or RNA helicase